MRFKINFSLPLRPDDFPRWLDLLLARIGLGCPACGWWRWESRCFSEPHWKVWQTAVALALSWTVVSLVIAVVFA
jgi:hypothetical protein